MRAPALLIVLDQGIPRDAAEMLRAAGRDCIHVGEIGMAAATDIEILEWARAKTAMVVTLDADFHTILAVTRASAPSVIRFRVQGANGTAVVKLLRPILERYAEELGVGCMITVKERKTTCHILPRVD